MRMLASHLEINQRLSTFQLSVTILVISQLSEFIVTDPGKLTFTLSSMFCCFVSYCSGPLIHQKCRVTFEDFQRTFE